MHILHAFQEGISTFVLIYILKGCSRYHPLALNGSVYDFKHLCTTPHSSLRGNGWVMLSFHNAGYNFPNTFSL